MEVKGNPSNVTQAFRLCAVMARMAMTRVAGASRSRHSGRGARATSAFSLLWRVPRSDQATIPKLAAKGQAAQHFMRGAFCGLGQFVP